MSISDALRLGLAGGVAVGAVVAVAAYLLENTRAGVWVDTQIKALLEGGL